MDAKQMRRLLDAFSREIRIIERGQRPRIELRKVGSGLVELDLSEVVGHEQLESDFEVERHGLKFRQIRVLMRGGGRVYVDMPYAIFSQIRREMMEDAEDDRADKRDPG